VHFDEVLINSLDGMIFIEQLLDAALELFMERNLIFNQKADLIFVETVHICKIDQI
jgi:hypothetical protein